VKIGDGGERVDEEDGEEEDEWRKRGSHDVFAFGLCLVIKLILKKEPLLMIIIILIFFFIYLRCFQENKTLHYSQ
jgi:hypothetical protein